MWSWERADDPEVVHALLRACDLYTSTPDAPPPLRNLDTTVRRVRSGSVHLLRHGSEPAATFTLTPDPPFAADLSIFPRSRRPLYLGRLAVSPAWLDRGAPVGAQCLRRALDLAAAAGADALRSEANPDLHGVRRLLDLFGFVEHGSSRDPDGRGRVYLEKRL